MAGQLGLSPVGLLKDQKLQTRKKCTVFENHTIMACYYKLEQLGLHQLIMVVLMVINITVCHAKISWTAHGKSVH